MNNESPAKNSLADVIYASKKQTQLSINAIKIGVIKSFNPSTQRAEVEIAYKQVRNILVDGTKVYQEYPVLQDCPVMTLFGGVDILSMPITIGDNCMLLFNDTDIDQWATNGDGQHPTTARMHDISDAIAIVGIRPLTNSIVNYLANGIRLSHGGGNAQIDLTDNLIESIATLFLHNGNMQITGDELVEGNSTTQGNHTVQGNMDIWGEMTGNGSAPINVNADVVFTSGKTLSGATLDSANGATGSFSTVTVLNGIVTGGS
jgi:hypothetical protein